MLALTTVDANEVSFENSNLITMLVLTQQYTTLFVRLAFSVVESQRLSQLYSSK